MNAELLYTSAPQGLKQGSRGFCTVQSTAGMPINLAMKLESLSGYRHLYPPGDSRASLNPVAWSHLKFSLGGRNVSVLSRIADYGLDYSQRTNKLAHHLVLDAPLPPAGPVTLIQQPGVMKTSWDGKCTTLPPPMVPGVSAPGPGVCRTWQRLTGDAGWAGMVAQHWMQPRAKPLHLIFAESQSGQLMQLLAESMALLPPSMFWEATFSTYVTSLPPDIDCKVRCLVAGSEEARAIAARHTVIDLTKPNPATPSGPAVEAARAGRSIQTAAAPVIAKAPEPMLEQKLEDDFFVFPDQDDAELTLQPDRPPPVVAPKLPPSRPVPLPPAASQEPHKEPRRAPMEDRARIATIVAVCSALLVLALGGLAAWRYQDLVSQVAELATDDHGSSNVLPPPDSPPPGSPPPDSPPPDSPPPDSPPPDSPPPDSPPTRTEATQKSSASLSISEITVEFQKGMEREPDSCAIAPGSTVFVKLKDGKASRAGLQYKRDGKQLAVFEPTQASDEVVLLVDSDFVEPNQELEILITGEDGLKCKQDIKSRTIGSAEIVIDAIDLSKKINDLVFEKKATRGDEATKIVDEVLDKYSVNIVMPIPAGSSEWFLDRRSLTGLVALNAFPIDHHLYKLNGMREILEGLASQFIKARVVGKNDFYKESTKRFFSHDLIWGGWRFKSHKDLADNITVLQDTVEIWFERKIRQIPTDSEDLKISGALNNLEIRSDPSSFLGFKACWKTKRSGLAPEDIFKEYLELRDNLLNFSSSSIVGDFHLNPDGREGGGFKMRVEVRTAIYDGVVGPARNRPSLPTGAPGGGK